MKPMQYFQVVSVFFTSTAREQFGEMMPSIIHCLGIGILLNILVQVKAYGLQGHRSQTDCMSDLTLAIRKA